MGGCFQKYFRQQNMQKGKEHETSHENLTHKLSSDSNEDIMAENKETHHMRSGIVAYKASNKCDSYQMLKSEQTMNRQASFEDMVENLSSNSNPYRRLKPQQKKKLSVFFDTIATNASIDYNNSEFQDIKSAVHQLLERLVPKINERGIFNISHIQACGSMAEKTAVWKIRKRYTRKAFTEFDFLAVLNDSIDRNCSQACPCCVRLTAPPVRLHPLQFYYSRNQDVLINSLNVPRTIDNLFLQELIWGLTSSCHCFFVEYMESKAPGREGTINRISLNHASPQHEQGCTICTVDMPTGILSVNTSIDIVKNTRFSKPANCSLILLWTSKTNSLSVPDDLLLEETRVVTSLPIYIDCLPALELFRRNQAGNRLEHANFLIPKRCGLGCYYGWRRSSCMVEINNMLHVMTNTHRKCYTIIKYILQLTGEDFNAKCVVVDFIKKINHYHVKTVALNHGRACSVSSDDCVECVLKMLSELHIAYANEDLKSFESKTNLLSSNINNTAQMEAYFCEIIDRLCSVSKTDSYGIIAQKLSKEINICDKA